MRIFEEISQKPKKYASLFGGVLIMFCLGSISTLATMSPYYMSYLREYNELKRVRYSQTIWLQTCYTVNKLFIFEIIFNFSYYCYFADICVSFGHFGWSIQD
jgi:hypothetical protein